MVAFLNTTYLSNSSTCLVNSTYIGTQNFNPHGLSCMHPRISLEYVRRHLSCIYFHQLLEAEDHYEGERKDLTGRLEALDSIVRMLELKHKNSLDHASRLEERENELKKVCYINSKCRLFNNNMTCPSTMVCCSFSCTAK